MNETNVEAYHLFEYFLIIVNESQKNVSTSLNDIFGIFMKLHLLNVNILIQSERTSLWSIHSYKPYARNCHTFDIFTIETFTSENYTNGLMVPFKDLFPPRKFKFHNCNLYIVTFPIEPYVILENNSNGVSYNGLDTMIANEISKELNLIPIYVYKNRGIVYSNRTATGALKMA